MFHKDSLQRRRDLLAATFWYPTISSSVALFYFCLQCFSILFTCLNTTRPWKLKKPFIPWNLSWFLPSPVPSHELSPPSSFQGTKTVALGPCVSLTSVFKFFKDKCFASSIHEHYQSAPFGLAHSRCSGHLLKWPGWWDVSSHPWSSSTECWRQWL